MRRLLQTFPTSGADLPLGLGFHDADRVSFELSEEDIEAVRAKFMAQAQLGARRQSLSDRGGGHGPPPAPSGDMAYDDWQRHHPSLIQHVSKFLTVVEGKRLAIFLDYDGTLAPIVKNPDLAFMSDEMRAAVKALAQSYPTAVISGRGREKVESFVQLSELYYAGSHGMDIAGPKGMTGQEPFRFEAAAEFRPEIDHVYTELTARLKDIPGSSVEHNKFCVSAHFRNCPVESWPQVVSVVHAVASEHPKLRITRGRKVLEVRPQVDWDKGSALNHLLEVLDLKSQTDVISIYIGDDTTDEDAFKLLRDNGLGIGVLVSTKAKPTFAFFTLRDPDEVLLFLTHLAKWGGSDSNGWHRNSACRGWKPQRTHDAKGA